MLRGVGNLNEQENQTFIFVFYDRSVGRDDPDGHRLSRRRRSGAGGHMYPNESLIAEIEHAVQRGSPAKRADALRSVTDLFIGTADRLSEEQVALFGDVIGHLINQ